MSESTDHIYKVVFYDQGRICELYAKEVLQGGLYGFIEVQELLFGTKTEVVIDPGEERLQREFTGVKRVHIPMHAVVRIDEVEQEGPSRMGEQPDKDGTVSHFPAPVYAPKGSDGG